VLLTRPPLAARRQPVRLACIRRAASVRPEPGSNSPDELWIYSASRPTIRSNHQGLPKQPWSRLRKRFGLLVLNLTGFTLCELLAHHSAVVNVRCCVYPLSRAARVIVPDEEALCQGTFSQLVHRLIRNFIHRIVDKVGRYPSSGHTKTGAYNAGRTITVLLIRVPRLAVPLRTIFSARPNEIGFVFATLHSGFSIITDRASPVKAFRHQF
jgi:hypothetical protein